MYYIQKLIGKPGYKWSDLFLAFLIITSIIGLLTIKKWTNICFYLILVVSFFHVKRSFSDLYQTGTIKRITPIIIMLSLPVLAILFGQFGRDAWLSRAFDAPSRMLFSIPILFFFIYKKINYSYVIGVTAPITMVVTLYSIFTHPEAVLNWGGRYATTFVDPNTLGTYSLLFSSFCLLNMDLNFKSSKAWYLYQFIGVLAGFVIIIGNGTRGSWLAIPFILALWIFFNYRKINKLAFIISTSSIVIFAVAVSFYFPRTLERVAGIYSVFTHWDNFGELDVAVHLRIYMWETAWQLFLQNPLFGYGDHNLTPYLNEYMARQNMLSTDITLNAHGPHNELLANALRSGFLGVVSVLGLFVIPMILFIKNTSHKSESISRAAKLGVVYITCLAICSMTLEVFTLKYTASFYGLLISGLIAQILASETESTFSPSNL